MLLLQLENWDGPFLLSVSLVTECEPYRQHPNTLKGCGSSSGKKDGDAEEERGYCFFKWKKGNVVTYVDYLYLIMIQSLEKEG